jgi:hypothetical protein
MSKLVAVGLISFIAGYLVTIMLNGAIYVVDYYRHDISKARDIKLNMTEDTVRSIMGDPLRFKVERRAAHDELKLLYAGGRIVIKLYGGRVGRVEIDGT